MQPVNPILKVVTSFVLKGAKWGARLGECTSAQLPALALGLYTSCHREPCILPRTSSLPCEHHILPNLVESSHVTSARH